MGLTRCYKTSARSWGRNENWYFYFAILAGQCLFMANFRGFWGVVPRNDVIYRYNPQKDLPSPEICPTVCFFVRPSVRPSHACFVTKKQYKAKILTSHERVINLVF